MGAARGQPPQRLTGQNWKTPPYHLAVADRIDADFALALHNVGHRVAGAATKRVRVDRPSRAVYLPSRWGTSFSFSQQLASSISVSSTIDCSMLTVHGRV
jgi:hypothetical protein